MLWIASTEAQIKAAQNPDSTQITSKKENEVNAILNLIPQINPISQEAIFLKSNIGVRRVRDILNLLVQEDKIFVHRIPSNGGRPAKGYAKIPPPNNQ